MVSATQQQQLFMCHQMAMKKEANEKQKADEVRRQQIGVSTRTKTSNDSTRTPLQMVGREGWMMLFSILCGWV